MATPNGEVAQMPAAATSKLGLNREAQAALLRVGTGPECPEDNLWDLTWDSNPNSGIGQREIREREREISLKKF